jgi:hypothetical protein
MNCTSSNIHNSLVSNNDMFMGFGKGTSNTGALTIGGHKTEPFGIRFDNVNSNIKLSLSTSTNHILDSVGHTFNGNCNFNNLARFVSTSGGDSNPAITIKNNTTDGYMQHFTNLNDDNKFNNIVESEDNAIITFNKALVLAKNVLGNSGIRIDGSTVLIRGSEDIFHALQTYGHDFKGVSYFYNNIIMANDNTGATTPGDKRQISASYLNLYGIYGNATSSNVTQIYQDDINLSFDNNSDTNGSSFSRSSFLFACNNLGSNVVGKQTTPLSFNSCLFTIDLSNNSGGSPIKYQAYNNNASYSGVNIGHNFTGNLYIDGSGGTFYPQLTIRQTSNKSRGMEHYTNLDDSANYNSITVAGDNAIISYKPLSIAYGGLGYWNGIRIDISNVRLSAGFTNYYDLSHSTGHNFYGNCYFNNSVTFTGNISANGLEIDSTELSYLNGVTSNIQTQFNNRALVSGTNAFTGTNTFNGVTNFEEYAYFNHVISFANRNFATHSISESLGSVKTSADYSFTTTSNTTLFYGLSIYRTYILFMNLCARYTSGTNAYENATTLKIALNNQLEEINAFDYKVLAIQKNNNYSIFPISCYITSSNIIYSYTTINVTNGTWDFKLTKIKLVCIS